MLTHWGRGTPICIYKLTIIGSDNGLSPGEHQAITWTNVGILLIGPLGTSISELLSGIQTFSSQKMHLKMSSAKWRPFCSGLNVLRSRCYKGETFSEGKCKTAAFYMNIHTNLAHVSSLNKQHISVPIYWNINTYIVSSILHVWDIIWLITAPRCPST